LLLSGVLHYTNQTGVRKITTFLQVLFLAIAIANVVSVSISIENKQGLSSINKIVAWTISSNAINLLFLRIAFLMFKMLYFFSFINVFDQKNYKYLIEQNISSFINWCSLYSIIIKYGSIIHDCTTNNIIMLEKNYDSIQKL